jgi:glc operon protein GlcG
VPVSSSSELKIGEIIMVQKTAVRFTIAALFVAGVLASALAQMPNPYGAPISLENAKKAAAPAIAEAEKNHWNMAVAIVDPSGNLVYYEKMDNTQLGSANVAIDKARSAALYKRPTKAFQDAVAAAGDGLRILRLQGAVPLEGGIPLVMEGKIVGAIGVSGAASAQDAQCAKAGADAIK